MEDILFTLYLAALGFFIWALKDKTDILNTFYIEHPWIGVFTCLG